MRWLVVLVAFAFAFAVAGCGRAVPVSATATATGAGSAAPEAAGAAAEAVADADELELLPEPNRALTAGERTMLRPIFRDGIEYGKVRVIDGAFPFQPSGTYMTPRGHIYAPGRLYREDFSLPSLSSGERAVFVHEMTHVWQFASGVDLVARAVAEFAKYRGAYEKAYPYRLEAGRDLVEYGMEQQASILEDYYLVTVDRDGPYRMENRGLSARERDELFAGVLRRFHADARYARGLSADELADRHGMSSDREPPGPAACEETEAQHGATHMCGWRFEPPRPKLKPNEPPKPKS